MNENTNSIRLTGYRLIRLGEIDESCNSYTFNRSVGGVIHTTHTVGNVSDWSFHINYYLVPVCKIPA
jgi:hypothetical protein